MEYDMGHEKVLPNICESTPDTCQEPDHVSKENGISTPKIVVEQMCQPTRTGGTASVE
jgi:hypothetical protein